MSDSHAALGFVETVGLAAAIEAADAACKTANVKLVGRENSKGNGMITIKIKGDVSAVKSALLSAHAAASKVNKVVSVSIIPRPGAGLEPVMVYNKETELDESPTCVEEAPKDTELTEGSIEAEEKKNQETKPQEEAEKKQETKPQEETEKEQNVAEPSEADKEDKKAAKKDAPAAETKDTKPAGKGTKRRTSRKSKKQ